MEAGSWDACRGASSCWRGWQEAWKRGALVVFGESRCKSRERQKDEIKDV